MWYLFNYLLNDPSKDDMQKLHPWEVDVPTYNFEVHKIVGISYSRVIYRIYPSRRNGLLPFHYFFPQWDISHDHSIDPNIDRIKMLCPREVNIPTYHIGV